MSGPFTIDEAHTIFCGNFHTSPTGIVDKSPGDRKWRMIHHLSKCDSEGLSTKCWLCSDAFPTVFYSELMVAFVIHHCVSLFLFWSSFSATCTSLVPYYVCPSLLVIPSLTFVLTVEIDCSSHLLSLTVCHLLVTICQHLLTVVKSW